MKKPKGLTTNKPLSTSLFGNRVKRSVSAAVLASAMMAGSPLVALPTNDLTVDGTSANVAERTVTINPGAPLSVDSVYVINGGQILGAGTLTASVAFDLSNGYIQANLAGAVDLSKNSSADFVLTGSNSYTGDTNINQGTLYLGDGVSGSISAEGTVFISGSGRLFLNQANDTAFANDVVIAAGGNFVLGSSGTTVLTGIVSGSGGIFVHDGGTVTGYNILTGSNSSTGYVGVESGALQIGDGFSGSISSDAFVYTHEDGRLILNLQYNGLFSNDIDNGGVVELATGSVNTVSGVISGSGSVVHSGTGVTYLTGSNSYEGATYVDSGVLVVGVGSSANGASISRSPYVEVSSRAELGIWLNDLESFTNSVNTSGTVGFLVDAGNEVASTNEIYGTGGVNKYGEGTLVFTNNYDDGTQHWYYGDTNVYEGTLLMGAEWSLSYRSSVYLGSEAVLDLNSYDQEIVMLTGYGTLITGDDDTDLYIGGDFYSEGLPDLSGDFYGDIIGDGYIYKEGKGIWTLHGYSPDFDGDIVVRDGAVRLLGYLGDADVNVESGGFFFGNGYIGDDLFNYGGVAAGIDHNTPATLTIDDDFVQYSSGTLYTQIASSKRYGRVVVGDDAELAGTLALVPVQGYVAKRRHKLTVLTADDSITGKFDKLKSYLPKTMLTPKVVYQSNSVVVEFEQGKFGDLKGLTANENAVGRGLDKVNTKSSLNGLFDQLNAINLDDVPDVLALLSPEQYAAIFNIGFAGSQTQFNNVERRLSDVRDGATGFSTSGLALTNSRGTLNYNGAPIVNDRDGLSLAGFDGKSIVGKNPVAPILTESRWSFFATGSGEWADVESTKNALGSEFTTGGVSIGADYRVSNNFVVGITGNYTNTGSDLNNGGKITVNSGRGAVYATVFDGGLYGNAVIGGGYNSYDLKRATFGGKAKGSTNGGQFDALLGGGYDYKIGGLTVGPIASAQYTYLGLSSFNETGSNAPLSFKSQHQESLKSTLGLKASYAFNVGGVKITPEVRAQWVHEFLDSTAAVESSFAAGGSAFTVNGAKIGRDGILFDAGLSAQFNDKFSVFAYYTGDYGRTNYTSNSVNGGFRVSF